MTSAGENANVFELRCYFSAFVSAARSISFVLQTVMKGIQGFDEWYITEQDQLRANQLARFFVERRNEIQKVGDTKINAGVGYRDENGQLIIRHYFANTGPLDPFEPIEDDIVTAATEYMKLMRKLISECSIRFATEDDPDTF